MATKKKPTKKAAAPLNFEMLLGVASELAETVKVRRLGDVEEDLTRRFKARIGTSDAGITTVDMLKIKVQSDRGVRVALTNWGNKVRRLAKEAA